MRKPIVAGNWKMNGSLASIRALLKELNEGLSSIDSLEKVGITVFPTSVYLSEVAVHTATSPIELGAQTLSEYESGAYTGECSADMIAELGCSQVLIGHSERRQLFGETDEVVANKVAAAISRKLIPVVCVGETLEEREAQATLAVVSRQVRAVIECCGVEAFLGCVIAYEPVWAIGTGKTAAPAQAQEVHEAIRALLKEYSVELADKTRILYGGSVNAKNADELFKQPDVDGGLVGGASLKANDFIAICRAAAATV